MTTNHQVRCNDCKGLNLIDENNCYYCGKKLQEGDKKEMHYAKKILTIEELEKRVKKLESRLAPPEMVTEDEKKRGAFPEGALCLFWDGRKDDPQHDRQGLYLKDFEDKIVHI